jgi:tRNA G18 (ribose-2'-O)-methylase SpoU
MKMTLVLDNIRSTYNVGAILRTADGFGVSKVILSGYTPRVHDMNLLPHMREKLDHEIHKTALGAEDMLDIYSCDDIKSELAKLREQGWQIVGLENNIQNVPLFQSNDPKLEEVLSDKVVLILGEEVNGIDYSLHEIIDLFIEIPMQGQKESFNVSVAAGIAMYQLMAK